MSIKLNNKIKGMGSQLLEQSTMSAKNRNIQHLYTYHGNIFFALDPYFMIYPW